MACLTKNIVFISATDTGAGKTLVTSVLLLALKKLGFKVDVLKLVETGCSRDEQGRLIAADAVFLASVLGPGTLAEKLVFKMFEAPAAPLVAARLEGVELSSKELLGEIVRRAEACEILLVEGAGGLLVPFSERETLLDLIQTLGAPLLIVVGSRLGAINHALLSFEVLRARQVETLGYVFNDLFASRTSEKEEPSQELCALKTNRKLLDDQAKRYGLSELGYLPYLTEPGDLLTLQRFAQSPLWLECARSLVNGLK